MSGSTASVDTVDMCNKNKLLALLLAFVLRSALTAPTKESLADPDFTSEELEEAEEEDERGLERQLLTTVFGSAAEAGASGLALPTLASFSWRQMLLRGLFMIFQMLMRSHHCASKSMTEHELNEAA